MLDQIIDNYNTSKHSTIKAKPEEVWNGVDENHQSHIYTQESEIKVDDLVRVKQLKTIFGKGDATKYSKEIYQVMEGNTTLSSNVAVGSAWILSGTGSPEGVKEAGVGSIFLRTDGGAGSSFYVKESGSANSGWVAK